MDQHHPELRVGVGSGGIPLIKYMNYNEKWDKEIVDLEECRNYANERMEKLKDVFEAILKE